ncbi:sensor histidine kinase [Geomesophilobacter sediminis]|uniref:histidine kinase n=1 Tax=Geomesophilobacter sediminis TaxID=2798584 RepID=A0A8J7LY26_9BACT|nr:HAMP domain-containing sensor histidine kinase [Geomesophilobacter sediminis]MBJ6724186.1 HAMP domain-containing histidine kinase [Geomesophilobacter sediminis]
MELHVAVEVETPEEMMVNGYRNGYAQALFNILVNARDAFGESRTSDAKLKVRACKRDGKAVVTVTDNAGGIQEDNLEKIFDPFFTTKKSGEGTGIGLFMSKTMIEKNMGGSLTARNVAGCAEFCIEVREGFSKDSGWGEK